MTGDDFTDFFAAEDKAAMDEGRGQPNGHDDATSWADPDMGVPGMHRRSPPRLPIEVFGPRWSDWIIEAADAAACPTDYVMGPLVAAASALIGNSRWAQATAGWSEPPHLWIGAVGDSGNGKSPGADCLTREVLPEIERRMISDYPDRLQEWRAGVEYEKVIEEKWKSEVRDAQKRGAPAPLPPVTAAGPEPKSPRLRQHDVTIEKVAALLGTAAPKGLLIWRDELTGWIDGMTSYNDAGRAFWVEAYGGRPYRLERQKHPEPIEIAYFVVAVYGTTQPDKIAALMRGADDGLLSRFLWLWPEPIPFRLGRALPGADWATASLDKLRELDLQPGAQPGAPARPIMVRLADEALPELEGFGRDMQRCQVTAGGLLRSALGKTRGQALRAALVLEFLWWCGADGFSPPPAQISARAFEEAHRLISDYFVPMAERTYGDASVTQADRNAATLARWILREPKHEVHVRTLLRGERLPGLRTADDIHAAAQVLVEAEWLSPPPRGTEFGRRGRVAYPVNPRLWALV